MATRPPAAEITKDLTTTADKIRALANADYDRTEISKILGIPYQHVRNVMLRSGVTGGIRREAEAEREPVEVDAAPAPREDTSWKVLTDAGFHFIGEWTQDPESLIRLDAKAPALPDVYAFIVDDIVVNVGLTLSGLRTRFRSILPWPQRPEDQLPHQRAHFANAACRQESEGACRHPRAVRVEGVSSQYSSGS